MPHPDNGSPTRAGGPRYAWYGRTASPAPDDATEALWWQVMAAENFVARHGGRIVARYWDIGPSGTDTAPSPKLVETVDLSRDGGIHDLRHHVTSRRSFNGVLVDTPARISRIASDVLRFEDTVLNAGLRLCVTSEPYPPTGRIAARLRVPLAPAFGTGATVEA